MSPPKYTVEQLQREFEKLGGTLLEKEYKGVAKKYKTMCSCGNIYYPVARDFLKGRKCNKCSKKGLKKLSNEEVQERYKNLGYELLEEYMGYNKPHKTRCLCGNVFLPTPGSVIRRKVLCSLCAKKKISQNRKTSILEVEKFFKENGGYQLLEDYKGASKTHKIQCVCGDTFHTAPSRILSSKVRCNECRKKKMKVIKQSDSEIVMKEFKELGYEVLEHYRGVDTPHKTRCPGCGDDYLISLTNARRKKRCRKCDAKRWKREGNPRWNPDLTDRERKERRKYPEYSEWRFGVMQRDLFTCQICGGKSQGNIEAHHIIPHSINRSLRLHPENGIALCIPCHREIHKQISLEDMTYESFWAYVREMRCSLQKVK